MFYYFLATISQNNVFFSVNENADKRKNVAVALAVLHIYKEIAKVYIY